MDSDIDSKKDLLKKEILDNNYDQNKFIEFCVSKKENGDDLSQWTLEELQEIIKEFISSQEISTSENMNNNLNIDSEKKEIETKEEKSNINNPNEINNQNIEGDIKQMAETKVEKTTKTQTINCRKLEKSQLNDKVIEVLVQNPKLIETSFISSNYINYEVSTPAMNWVVFRRYSDFLWLRSVLVKFFSGHVVPPIPNKKSGGRRFEKDFIEKRMKFLQKFISAVIENEIYKASEPLIAFLSMTDHNQFEAKMKELTSFQPSPYIEEIKTFSGTVSIASSQDDNEKYFKNIANYFRIQYQLYERLNGNLKEFYNNFYATQKSMENIQKDFEILHLLNTRVAMKEAITKTYEEYGIFFKNWSRILYKQNITVKSHIKEFFKFAKMEGTSYSELISRRDEARDKYLNFNNKLTQKKEKHWLNKDISKWEIDEDMGKIDKAKLTQDKEYAFSKMCTKDSLLLNAYKNQLGYCNKTNIDELKNMIKNNCQKFIENDNKFCSEFYPTLTDALNVYSTFQMFIATSQMNAQMEMIEKTNEKKKSEN